MPTQKQIFPSEILEYSSEVHFARHSKSSQIIYITVLLVVVGAFVALPFVYVDISVRALGMVTSSQNKTELYMPVSAQVKEVFIQENQSVREGETLLTLYMPSLSEQMRYASENMLVLAGFIGDLEKLGQLDSASLLKGDLVLKTKLYQQEYVHLFEQL